MGISSLTYTYPISQEFDFGDTPISVGEIKALFERFFVGESSRFLELRDLLIDELNKIFGKTIKPSDTYDHITFAKFVSKYADDCIEAVNAYKFYGNRIVNQINTLTDYIKNANELLGKWDTINVNNSTDQAISDQIHSDVVDLECLVNFCLEIETKFCKRYIYDFDEDNWKADYDHYCKITTTGTVIFDDGEHKITTTDPEKFNPNTQIDTTKVKTLSALRSLQVFCDRRGKQNGQGIYYKKTLECYNELNLLDRLKYIKVYYDLTGGKTDYVFPNDTTFGLPCVKDEEKNGKITKYLANIEKFYLGYLIDRDGPVNAFAGFFEMKVKALEAAISLKQEELKALNAYLNFINRGLDVLTGSQSSGSNRICDGAIIAITYLCGQKMYKLFTDESGKEFLVLPSVEEKNKFFLVPNDKFGMQFLLGDDGKAGKFRGNSSTSLTDQDGDSVSKENNLWPLRYASCDSENSYTVESPKSYADNATDAYYYTSKGKSKSVKVVFSLHGVVFYSKDVVFYEVDEIRIQGKFSLPDELEVNSIDPTSVYKYANAMSSWNNEDNNDHVKWSTVIESWTNAFQTKTTYLNTAIQNTQTDIQTFRDTIDIFESLTKTLRSRTHDAGINVVSKLIS